MNIIKAFVIDIDGTLTENGNGRVHLPALSYLRNLEDMGFKVIYATGRSAAEAFVLATFGGTTKIAIGENGGTVMISPKDVIMFADLEKCMNGYNILLKYIKQIELKAVFPRLSEVVLLRNFDIMEGQEILDNHNLNLKLTDSQYAYHINEKGIDKTIGLEKALDILKISKEEIVAIGDSETDIPLFKYCKHSIALGHSLDKVKSAAKHVVQGREGYGLVEAIDHVIYHWCA